MNHLVAHASVVAARCCALLLVSAGVAQAQSDVVFRDAFEALAATTRCASAPSISAGTPADGVIATEGELDFYRYQAQAGEWLSLRIDANPDIDPARLDSVVTLYTGDGAVQLARNDDDVFRGVEQRGYDSSLVFHSETAQTYCILVEDFSTATGQHTTNGGPSYDYTLAAAPIDFASPAFELDAEPNDDTTSAQLATASDVQGNQLARIAGSFAGPSDVDVYRFTTSTTAKTMRIEFAPAGPSGYGGSVGLGLVEVVASNGTTLLSRLDVALGAKAIDLPVTGSTAYFVVVRAPASPLGAHPTYFIQWQAVTSQNQQEAGTTANQTAAGAGVATPFPQDGRTSYFIGGTLSRDDVDWWSFIADAGARIEVFCSSRREGSGVIDASFALYGDPAAAALVSQTETATSDVAWHDGFGASRPAVTATVSGTYYLRVGAALVSAAVTDRHYTCGIHAVGP